MKICNIGEADVIHRHSHKKRQHAIWLMLFLFLFAVPFGLKAQENDTYTLTGTVYTADNNEPVPGANIIIKGTTRGTTSDMDGKYSLDVTSDETLEVSFVGYLTETKDISGAKQIDFHLVQNISDLDEVVVIGYGVQKKKLNTGATSQVKGDELEKLNTTNALQAMQGQAAGINITSTSGQPGEGMKVTIRGLGTTNHSSPLYIVDGVQTGDINYLNNADIASVDVLKDAASAAIYGSRAANGVVLITTKQGQTGKSQIGFDAYYGLQNRAKKIELLDAKQYAMIMNEQYLNSGGSVAGLPFDVNDLPYYTGNSVANTQWLDKMFVNNAATQNYTLSASGGSNQSTYSLSISYTGQEGIVGGRSESNYERYGGRFNSENKLYNDKVTIGEHLSYTYTNKNGISVGNQYNNTLRSAFNTSPILPVYDKNGDFFNTNDPANTDQFGNPYWNNLEANPYASMVYNNQNITNDQKLVGDIYAEIQPVTNLNFRTSFGVDYNSGQYRSFTPIYELSMYSFSDYTKATQQMSKNIALNWDNTLSYQFLSGAHSLNGMVGMSSRNYTGSWMESQNADLAFNDLQHAWMNNATNQDYAKLSIQGAPNDADKLLSYFGRLQYNYNETYLLNFTFRADGSSKFAKVNRWGYFPSVSAGWVITNESFMDQITPVMNFLKFRASWGQNGNQNIDAFQYMAPIKFTQATYAFGNTEGVSVPGSYPSRLAYENLKWETSEQTDLGFDSRFLNSRLAVNFDWYRKSTKDWLIVAPILATAGTGAPFINGGKVINSGVELGLSFNNVTGDFHYTISANGAYNKNDVQDIPTNDGIIHGASNTLYNNSTEFYRAQAGHPIGYFWGYQTNGLFQSSSDVNSYVYNGKIVQPNAKPGDVRYIDQNMDGKIDEKDKVQIGNPNPDFVFGLTFNFDYKAFDFLVQTNGVAGNQIVQSYRNQTDKYANYTTEILNRWTGKGTSNEIPRVTNSNINYQFSDLFVKDGSYLRISNVTLGYDVAKVVHLNNFSQCRIYASVQNLYTFTKYDGMDPEVGYGFDNGATDRFSSGIDLGFYPRPRTVLFGISLKF